MTKKRAREILWLVWGNQTAIDLRTVGEIESVALDGETLLQTCSRVGEVPEAARVKPFDTGTMRRVLSLADAIGEVL